MYFEVEKMQSKPNLWKLARINLLIITLFLLSSCGVPQRWWPQKDLAKARSTLDENTRGVLLASRDSEFKQALVAELSSALDSGDIAYQIIGIEALKEVDASEYRTVVVISSCLAWGLHHDVQTFLDKQKKHNNIIMVTTSGDGSWLPAQKGRDFDDLSTASEMTSVASVTGQVMQKIKAHSDK